MISTSEIRNSLLHILFPNVCVGCGSDRMPGHTVLCLQCLHNLPETRFENYPGNPVEKKFWGRLTLAGATAQFYFSRDSLMQTLMHEFKYGGNREIGHQLGRMMGESISRSGRFEADVLVPLPLFESKEKRRGFNQSAILCEGMTEKMRIPVLKDLISRTTFTDTQTRKSRIERWLNMEGKFVLTDEAAARGKHILLVDDVVTTGATLEACGMELVKTEGARLSIATLCYATH